MLKLTTDLINDLSEDEINTLLEPFSSSYQIADSGDCDNSYVFNGGMQFDETDQDNMFDYMIERQDEIMPCGLINKICDMRSKRKKSGKYEACHTSAGI